MFGRAFESILKRLRQAVPALLLLWLILFAAMCMDAFWPYVALVTRSLFADAHTAVFRSSLEVEVPEGWVVNATTRPPWTAEEDEAVRPHPGSDISVLWHGAPGPVLFLNSGGTAERVRVGNFEDDVDWTGVDLSGLKSLKVGSSEGFYRVISETETSISATIVIPSKSMYIGFVGSHRSWDLWLHAFKAAKWKNSTDSSA